MHTMIGLDFLGGKKYSENQLWVQLFFESDSNKYIFLSRFNFFSMLIQEPFAV